MNKTQEIKCLFNHHGKLTKIRKGIWGCLHCGYAVGKFPNRKWHGKFDKSFKHLLYRQFEDGTEEWYKYDKNDRLLHFRKSDGVNVEYTYGKYNQTTTKVYDGPSGKFTGNS